MEDNKTVKKAKTGNSSDNKQKAKQKSGPQFASLDQPTETEGNDDDDDLLSHI